MLEPWAQEAYRLIDTHGIDNLVVSAHDILATSQVCLFVEDPEYKQALLAVAQKAHIDASLGTAKNLNLYKHWNSPAPDACRT